MEIKQEILPPHDLRVDACAERSTMTGTKDMVRAAHARASACGQVGVGESTEQLAKRARGAPPSNEPHNDDTEMH